jgi:pectate lyase
MQTDTANCGACGKACSTGQTCSNGACTGGTNNSCPPSNALTGWATQAGGTTGGGSGAATTVTSLSALNSAAKGTNTAVIQVSGTISGDVTVGSNKTIIGACGGKATIQGHIQMSGSKNVIIRNLNIIGNNCSDSPSDCSAGEDGISIEGASNHIWIDHCDIKDGSDGNTDITHASDYITISWTKFHYSSARTDPANSGGHRFSNLIGHSDSNSSEDTGHLRVTFDHVWWADFVYERAPRVRFGQVHVMNTLWTNTGNLYCVGAGVNANILVENSVFVGVKNPVDGEDASANSATVVGLNGDVFTNTTGTKAAIGSGVFKPPYTYTLDATGGLQAAVQSGAGPK